MNYDDLYIRATREIKYYQPKLQEWVSDTQSYVLDTAIFDPNDNKIVVESEDPYKTYCDFLLKYYGKNPIMQSETKEYLDKQLLQAYNYGYKIEWGVR